MLLELSMNEVRAEDGSSLIWFSTLVGVTVCLVLVLSSAIHQFLFARSLKDYLEQLSLVTLSAWDGKSEVELLVSSMTTEFPTTVPGFQFESIELLPGPTLLLRACGRWVSPIPVVEIATEICESAMAR